MYICQYLSLSNRFPLSGQPSLTKLADEDCLGCFTLCFRECNGISSSSHHYIVITIINQYIYIYNCWDILGHYINSDGISHSHYLRNEGVYRISCDHNPTSDWVFATNKRRQKNSCKPMKAGTSRNLMLLQIESNPQLFWALQPLHTGCRCSRSFMAIWDESDHIWPPEKEKHPWHLYNWQDTSDNLT